MPQFSAKSIERLQTCHPDLQRVCNEVIKHFDCTVLCGTRPKADQDAAVAAGNSKTPWPKSKHNPMPSRAVDIGPYEKPEQPIDWADRERLTLFAGFMLGTAASLGINLRWGGDWDQDTEVQDNSFDDLVHFELGTGGAA
jgi:hypothetical protein